MSLLFNILSRFDIAFLPRSKYLLISWLQSPSAVTPVKMVSINLPIVLVKTGQSVETQTLVGFMTNLVSIS